jgi:hypothetical protein
MPEPGPRPSTGVTRLLRYHEPLRLPQRPGADHFRSPRSVVATHRRRGSRTLPQRPCAHADSNTPAEESGFFGRLLPRPPTAFPLCQEGRLQQGTIGAFSEFTRFGLRICTLVAPGTSPEASAGRLLASTAPVATGAYRQLPGRDSHPLAFETQEVSLLQLNSQKTSFRAALTIDANAQRRGGVRAALPLCHGIAVTRDVQVEFLDRGVSTPPACTPGFCLTLFVWFEAPYRPFIRSKISSTSSGRVRTL